jgi:hypothetical protein
VALVAYSFGGLVLKSLVVEAHKHVHQRPINGLDDEVHKCCKTFLNNVKGVVFYGVPHADGTQNLSNYFTWQHQQINTLSEYATQSGLLKKLEFSIHKWSTFQRILRMLFMKTSTFMHLVKD